MYVYAEVLFTFFLGRSARSVTKHDIYLNNKMEQKYGHSNIELIHAQSLISLYVIIAVMACHYGHTWPTFGVVTRAHTQSHCDAIYYSFKNALHQRQRYARWTISMLFKGIHF